MKRKDVMGLYTRERILTIRLLEKAAKKPRYAVSLGIVCMREDICQEDVEAPP